MSIDNDLEQLVSCNYIPWEKLNEKTILVTGATGLIGSNLIRGLTYADKVKKLNLHVIALARNVAKARLKFNALLNENNSLEILEGDIEKIQKIEPRIDYIIHGASPTESLFFIKNPVETIKVSVSGTINMLELAKEKEVQGFAYLSSMEVYGASNTEDILAEEDVGYMNPLKVRNCYPQSKRECEALCVAYASEYNVPAMSVRLAQTFGPGVDKNDTRVFAEFAKCAMEGKEIVLQTDGRSKRCYLYTMDAVSAILTVLLKGEPGMAYNAANPDTYCSVKDMAQLVAEEISENTIKVKKSENKENIKKFPPLHFYNLGIERISGLGWKATKGLDEMYSSLIGYWKDEMK
jgi:nucleoside-diphosphate-sugar epimerase